MTLVLVTALGVGGATVIGALLGFCFGKINEKWNDGILGFAAGIMLAAAVLGLIVPSMESAGRSGLWMTVTGVLAGAFFLNLADKMTPHLHHLTGVHEEEHRNNSQIDKIMLFVMAIAIHNLPEGMVIISPMLLSGISRRRTFFIASMTGVVEVLGTFVGFFAAGLSGAILPFALAFAGGTMLYVISDEMIPETHSHGHERLATYALIIGFLVMIVMDMMIG